MNQYETVFILTPVLSESQVKEAVEKYVGLINEANGKIIHREDWGNKKLAYTIEKKGTGYYTLLHFEAQPEFIAKLETAYRRDEQMLRFLTFRLQKEAVIYAQRRINKQSNTAE